MKVYPIQTGTVRIRPAQQTGVGTGSARTLHVLRDNEWTERLPIFAWLIEHSDGLILVDTGDTARTTEPGYFPRWHPYYRRAVDFSISPEEEIGPLLWERGVSPRDVRTVVLTHLHSDHAGGLHHFPRSEFLVSSREYANASGLRGRLAGYLPHRWPDWFSPSTIHLEPALGSVLTSGHPVTGDGSVRLVPTPGHTPGHLSVVVDNGDHRLFLAGDTSYDQHNLLTGKVDGVSPQADVALATLGRIRAFCSVRPTIYLPSHDPAAADRLQCGTRAPTAPQLRAA